MRPVDKSRKPNPNRHHGDRRTKLTPNHTCFHCRVQADGGIRYGSAISDRMRRSYEGTPCGYRKRVGLPAIPWGSGS